MNITEGILYSIVAALSVLISAGIIYYYIGCYIIYVFAAASIHSTIVFVFMKIANEDIPV